MKKTYFNHDSNARNDIRIIKLRAILGYEGYGLFWAVLELLFSEENKLCIEDYNSLAFGLQCDPKILKQVIEDFDLFVIEDGCFYSHRLHHQIKQINSKSQKAKESVNKRWNNIRTNNGSNTSISINKEDKNKSKNIEKRFTEFKNSVQSISDIDKEDKIAFLEYWSEPNKSNTRMRWELEKTWDLSRRLKRWANSNFNQNKKEKYLDYFDEYTYKKLDATKRKEYEEHLKSLGWVSIYSPNAGMVWTKKK
tara:strand:- start:19 stop:771 length:753 start_codon:yes stop_codon:yes gene_type:complete